MALIGYGIGLALIWVLAWGTPTPANILGGLAVAGVMLAVAPDARPPLRGGIRLRPVAIARFAGYLVVEAVKANVVLTQEVLRGGSRITTGVVAVRLPECSDGLLTLVTNVMAVTPGTMPIEVTRHPTVVYVHVLLLGDVEDVRRDVRHLAALAYRAFGSPEAITAMDALERDGATP